MELSCLLLLYKTQQFRFVFRQMCGVKGDLVGWDDEGALGAIVRLLVLLEEGLQLEVHARRGDHVDVWYVGVGRLTAFLGGVPQEVLRVRIARPPAHHLLPSLLQEILDDLCGLLTVQPTHQLIKADVLQPGVVGRVGEVEGDLPLDGGVAGAQVLDVLDSNPQLYVGHKDGDGHGTGPVGDQLRQLVESVHAGLGAQAQQAGGGERGPVRARHTEHVSLELAELVEHSLAQLHPRLRQRLCGRRDWSGGRGGRDEAVRGEGGVRGVRVLYTQQQPRVLPGLAGGV